LPTTLLRNRLREHLKSGTSFYLYGPNASKIGYWGGDYGGCAYDVGVIWLYEGNWPTYRNRIIHGDPAAGEYWTVTRPDIPSSWGCGISLPRTGYQSYEYHVGDGTPYRVGSATGFYTGTSSGPCTFVTNLRTHDAPGGGFYTDSGTPWILDGHTDAPWAVSTGKYSPPPYDFWYLYITPLYYGMNAMNTYWSGIGNHVGAHLCTSSDCGGIGGA